MAIIINKEENIFSLNTINTSYVFGIDDEGLIRSLYWGRKINHIDDFELIKLEEVSTNDPVYEITPEEYPVYGGLRYKEHCLKVNFNDGTREVKYKFVGYKVEENKLIVSLKDEYYDLEINLNYIIHEKYDLLERYVTVKNNSSEVMEIEKIYSGQFHIPYENLNFRNVHGHWGAEQQMFNQKVGYGKIYIENRRGISTHNHNPYFILDKDASETNGEVFFGALKLSGNFSGIVEQTPYGETLVQLGINPHDFILELKGGEEFKTPAIIAGYTNEGFEKMSHNLHNYGENELMRDGLRDILYNSWEATEFKVSCNEQIKLAKKAKELGAELFVVDDGWFGERDGIDNGLGDWYVNEKKFPNGLNQLIAAVKDMDMKFGIWFEPEMVNPKSQLYKDHPDWIYNFKTRESDTSRGQYVLNLSKDEVKEFIYNTLDQMLSTYDIDYIKWDANRPISQSDVKKDIWFKHIENLYDIVRKLKEKHPKVYFEACASGGGRIDFGSLEVFDDYWTSDNTDAYDRLTIQDSYSYIYPIKAMRAWVTDCPNFLSKRIIPLEFRFHSAMMGTLGIGCNILKYSKEDDEIAKKLISEYKTIRHIIQEGDFYRLENTSSNDYYLYQYLKKNESVVFVFLPQSKIGHRGTRVKLRGLESDKKYTVEYLGKTIEKTGQYLMNYGLDIRLEGDYSSCIIKLK